MTTVCIIGPNLIDQTKGDFHVHAFGCTDTLRNREYRLHRDDARCPVEVESLRDVVEYIYPADDFGYDADTEWRSYADGIYVLPCAVLA